MQKFQQETISPSGWSKRCVIVTILASVVVFFCVGIGIGYVIGKIKYDEDDIVTTSKHSTTPKPTVRLTGKQKQEKRFAQHKDILKNISADNIKKNLKYFTEYTHPSGSDQSKVLGDYIAQTWKGNGFDKIETFKYNIYMNYPEVPAEITIVNNNSVAKKLIINSEPAMDDSEKKGKVIYPFHAFSPSGNVTAEYVYGNYGLDSDFEKLKELGIDVKGKIMILRYGKTARSNKAFRSQARGAVGVIVFTDPYDHTYIGQEYPNGWMLNKHGVQRGTINWLQGDALSLGYPAKDGYFRINESKYANNPEIPSQPISYATAYEILSQMKNDSIPTPVNFKGGLNVSYALQSGKGREVTLNISTKFETISTYTVCGTLYGKNEPDRYVMMGNHRDAWTYGAADPSSGTAAMMEITRALGARKKSEGWRPSRSIMACSWGAEEVGILGSTEWADENHRFLTEKVALYLNIDMAVEGNFTVRLRTVDSVADVVYQAAKIIPAPDTPNRTLYDDWHIKSAMLKKTNTSAVPKPTYTTLSSGSDYKALWHKYGTTSADFRYYFSRLEYPKLPQNGHYHTAYESFGWMNKFVDPGFIHHQAIARLWGGTALIAADANIIPLNIVAYTKQVKYYLLKFEKRYKSMLEPRSISLTFALQRLDKLIKKTEDFMKWVNGLNDEKRTQNIIRSINDKIMGFERNFILPGLTSDPTARHVVYATIRSKLYSEKFPGISAAIFHAVKNSSSDWDEVRKQLTFVVWCFDTANRSLNIEE